MLQEKFPPHFKVFLLNFQMPPLLLAFYRSTHRPAEYPSKGSILSKKPLGPWIQLMTLFSASSRMLCHSPHYILLTCSSSVVFKRKDHGACFLDRKLLESKTFLLLVLNPLLPNVCEHQPEQIADTQQTFVEQTAGEVSFLRQVLT